jgi:hypothetical protein
LHVDYDNLISAGYVDTVVGSDAGESHERCAGLAEGGSGAEQPWELRAVGALKVRQRLAHVAWHRALPGLAAFALEDGSLRTVEARPEVRGFLLVP